MNETIPTIRKGIPCPPKGHQATAMKVEFLKQMKVGDSFHTDTESQRRIWLRRAQKNGISITSRKENGTGYGVWRVK